MKHTLEENRLFPYLAWGCVIVGALAVLNLTFVINDVSDDLQERTNRSLEALQVVDDTSS